MACSACKIGMRRPPRRGGILAPFIHRFIKTKLPRYIHPGWVRVDCGVLVRKQTRHQAVLCERSSPAFSCLKCSSRVNLDLQASRIFRPTPHTKTWSNFVLSYFVRTWPTGLLLRFRVNASCLDSSRFGRSRQVANRASCVNTVIIEGTRCKVHLLWRWLVSAPSNGYSQSSPCMHRVWIAVDSGVPIRQQTGHHVACVARECTL